MAVVTYALGEYPRNSCRKYQAPAMADVTNFITDKPDSMKSQVPSPCDGNCFQEQYNLLLLWTQSGIARTSAEPKDF